ncbi:MAG: hypothetical protein UY83_C0012G0004 [Candidatus Adlerbacteria bacterium GW2011_GWA1_54_10]|nr:MAG: hypothetical protein UY83_C0012G0004 [Candidatus Adlerbacteria bacterium GW2011_GWA1_54_10]KKW41583.1 MAG: hypothetical protein UY91_C0013G0002 [Parcubacteria group bacterium GW2011_GWB1_55_9]
MTANITTEGLASLAMGRRIPDFFENVWERRTGVNPVAVALRIRQNKRYEEKAMFGTVLLVYVAISSVLAFTLSSDEGWWTGGGSHPWLLLVQWLSLAIMLSLGTSLIFAGLGGRELISEGEIQNAKDFCRHLTTFCIWGDCSLGELTHSAGEGEARQVAEALLIGDAQAALSHEKTMSDLSNRYDVLAHLGLVSGGYDKFFKAAKKKPVKAA